MVRSKKAIAVESLKHALLRWNKQFGLGVNKAEATAILDIASKIVDRKIAAADDFN